MAHPILVLVWVTGIMALARSFGGAFVHHVKHTAILISSAALGCIGLLILGYSVDNFILAMLGAAVFGLGVAFFWPTMLGFVSEKIPATGALGLSLMGGIGFLGGAIAQPVLGNIYETQTKLLGNELAGGASTLLYVAIVPAVLVVAFLVLYVWQRKK
jgi:MFS family permease